MIKFFRKIRQNLLLEGKTGKYVKYAIGEIFLVVIGILIALSINNWNQQRISHKQSISYLKSLVDDIKSDIIQYNVNIESYKTDISNNTRLFINDDYKKLHVDSILKLVNIFYQPNKITKQSYEKIKNAGLAESLGTNIVNKAVNDYYNLEIKYYETLLQWDKEYSNEFYKFWFYNNNYESSAIRGYSSIKLQFLTTEEKRKNDLINLIESTQGRNYIRGAIERHEHTLKRAKEIKSVAENLVEMIINELNYQ
jgi:hypothetical protein